MFLGTLILTLPITVVGNNFAACVRGHEVDELKKAVKDSMMRKPDGTTTLADLRETLATRSRFSTTASMLDRVVTQAFKKFDVDHSGSLDSDEVAMFMTSIDDHLN